MPLYWDKVSDKYSQLLFSSLTTAVSSIILCVVSCALYHKQVDSSIREIGVRLERIFYDPAGSFVWLPDIFFHDGILRSSFTNND